MKFAFALVAVSTLVVLSLAQAYQKPSSTYTLKYYTNEVARVYMDGKLVRPRKSLDGLREIAVDSCDDILFFLKKRRQSVPTALSAFLVHNGIAPLEEGKPSVYATRQVVKGTIKDYSNPGQFKDAYVFQYDPAFDESKMAPLFAISRNLTSYLDPSVGMDGIINVKNLGRQLMKLQDGEGRLSPSFLDLNTWITATPVDAVLLDKYPMFKKLFSYGALPLNWRDGFMRRGYYALKICNPLCYPDNYVTNVMTGCYSKPVF